MPQGSHYLQIIETIINSLHINWATTCFSPQGMAVMCYRLVSFWHLLCKPEAMTIPYKKAMVNKPQLFHRWLYLVVNKCQCWNIWPPGSWSEQYKTFKIGWEGGWLEQGQVGTPLVLGTEAWYIAVMSLPLVYTLLSASGQTTILAVWSPLFAGEEFGIWKGQKSHFSSNW